jgi:AbrB family looped-hinge helix DNA binding protein
MATTTLTSKGQITIPIAVRRALGLKTGDRIEIFEQEDGKYALQPKTGSIMDLRGCVPTSDHVMTLEEMDQAILDHAARLDDATRSDAKENLAEEVAA